MKASRGLRNQMLDSDSFKAIMEANDNCQLKIYSGTPPANARDAVPAGATLLATITGDGGSSGLNFDAAASQGVLAKDSNQVWGGTVAADGQATWFRLIADGDSGNASDSEPRIQGTVGLSGEDLNLSDDQLTESAVQTIDYFVVNLPAGS